MTADGIEHSAGRMRGHSSTAVLPGWARDLALHVDRSALVDVAVENVRGDLFRAQQQDPGFVEHLRASAIENTERFWSLLSEQVLLEDIELVAPLEFARVQARIGISQATLHSAFRRAYTHVWRWWTGELTRRSHEVDAGPGDLALAIEISTDRMLSYWNLALDVIGEAYSETERQARHTGEQARLHAIRNLIRGDTSDPPDELFQILRYDVTRHHVGIRLYGDEGAVAGIVQRVRSDSKAVAILTGRLSLSEIVLWVGRVGGWSRTLIDQLRADCEQADVMVDVSQPASGAGGFVSIYSQLREVASVRALWGTRAPNVLTFDECQLDSLALRDLDSARSFVARELGPLAASTKSAQRLRETLAASFTYGSHVATAERLGLHEHTVRNRLQRARELLGDRVGERTLEVQMALRLHRFVGSPEDDQ